MLVKKEKSRFFFFIILFSRGFAIVEKFKTHFFIIIVCVCSFGVDFCVYLFSPYRSIWRQSASNQLMMMTLSAFHASIKGRKFLPFNKFHPPPHRPQLLLPSTLFGLFCSSKTKKKFYRNLGTKWKEPKKKCLAIHFPSAQCRQSFSQLKKQKTNKFSCNSKQKKN